MKYWIGVASKDHALRGVKEGIAQVCHGKKAPLARMKSGDWLIYYSSVKTFTSLETPGQRNKKENQCQSFVSIGRIVDDVVYQYEMTPGFIPYRRRVEYLPSNQIRDVQLHEVKDKLEFIQRNLSNWGLILRRGLFEISLHDFQLIRDRMTKSNNTNIATAMVAESNRSSISPFVNNESSNNDNERMVYDLTQDDIACSASSRCNMNVIKKQKKLINRK